jgi:hypothetical protein
MEGKINFFANEHEGTTRPHYKGYLEIEVDGVGVVHEFAVWPAKTGNGWSGRYKPKQSKPVETVSTGALPTDDIVKEAKKIFSGAEVKRPF